MTTDMTPSTPLDGEALARRAVEICVDRKATDIILFDVRGESLMTDFCLVCSGNSEPQIRAIAGHLEETLDEAGVRPAHVDGVASSRWMVIDYGTLLVHVFHPELRRYYQLEKLLGEERILVSEAMTPKPEVDPVTG